MSVAIIGRCETSRRSAPSDDPDWQSWQLAWDMEPHGNTTRFFEIHTPNVWDNGTISGLYSEHGGYAGWLKAISKDGWGEVVLQEEYFSGATKYPLDEVMKLPGMETGYLESSIAYMLAMAFLEGVEKVGIWGVDMTAGDEYDYQRPNMAYLMGLFRGLGMRIVVPRCSDLKQLDELECTSIPDFRTSEMDRYSLEYLLGRHVAATGEVPVEKRPDLMTSIFSDPPRYGYGCLPTTKAA